MATDAVPGFVLFEYDTVYPVDDVNVVPLYETEIVAVIAEPVYVVLDGVAVTVQSDKLLCPIDHDTVFAPVEPSLHV